MVLTHQAVQLEEFPTCRVAGALLHEAVVLLVFQTLGQKSHGHGLLLDRQKLLSHLLVQGQKLLDQVTASPGAASSTTTCNVTGTISNIRMTVNLSK